MEVSDIEWKFTFDPETFALGGAPTVKAPYYAKSNTDLPTWCGHEGINCAALSLEYQMHKTRKNYAQRRGLLLSNALALQQKLGWGEYCNHYDIEKFVELYPTYKVSILEPAHILHQPIHTFTGKDYVHDKMQKIIFLVYDPLQEHYGCTSWPVKMANIIALKTTAYKSYAMCTKCLVFFGKNRNHKCGTTKTTPRYESAQACNKCGIYGKHDCPYFNCRTCAQSIEKGTEHRCLVQTKIKANQEYDSGANDGKLPALWCYDMESQFSVTHSHRKLIVDFKTIDGEYSTTTDVAVYEYSVENHEANFIVCINNITGEQKEFTGQHCLSRFLSFATSYNGGNNIFLAHNASGYDARILLSALKEKFPGKSSVKPIMRGGKILQITIEKVCTRSTKTIFRDSLLHMKGSLKALAKGFCKSGMRKGVYPYKFNTKENWNYVGPIPAKKYFDISMTAKSAQDWRDLDVWYASRLRDKPEWNHAEETRLYCIDDVKILVEMTNAYNDINIKAYGVSPWKYATAPSHTHAIYLFEQTRLMNDVLDPLRLEPTRCEEARLQLLKEKWVVLKDWEHNFVTQALRGGRTDARTLYCKITDEEYAQGIRIKYQDIHSAYPFQQIFEEYPVGVPTIYAYDYAFIPCAGPSCKRRTECHCSNKGLDKGVNQVINIITDAPVPSVYNILSDPEFFGYVCVTMSPSKLYHPVVTVYDEEAKKSIATCNRIVKGYFTSFEFKRCLEMGYTLETFHAYHKYTKAPSLWRNLSIQMYVGKMIHSKDNPPEEEFDKLCSMYDARFGSDFGDAIRATRGTWKKDKAAALTFKIAMNAGWGKHCERAIKETSVIHDVNTEREEISSLFYDIRRGAYKFKTATCFGKNHVLYKYIPGGVGVSPNLHNKYTPAAVMVPSYGRLYLWEEMNKLGKRALYNDTDSIVYKYIPGEYEIPESPLLGGWGEEDDSVFEAHGGIVEFVALGPKTYGYRCKDGHSVVKAKGVSLNHATSRLVNFESMREIVLGLQQNTDIMIKVPQTNFIWNLEKGMRTCKTLKDLKFTRSAQKGYLNVAEFRVYPFGYNELH